MANSCKVVLLIFVLSVCNAQFSQSKNIKYAKVIDNTTKQPIAFSTVFIKNTNLGLYTNEEGDFTISNASKFIKDTLVISSVGYQKKYIPFKALFFDVVNKIYLDVATEKLEEVVITANLTRKAKKRLRKEKRKQSRPRSLIEEAIKRIPQNYPSKPFTLVSYYRDYLKRNKEYFNLNESIIQTIDSGFSTLPNKKRFRLLEYRRNKDFPVKNYIPEQYDSIWKTANYDYPNKFIPYASIPNNGGNELFILLAHDPIRNFEIKSFAFIYKLKTDFINFHSFKKPEIVFNDDLKLLKVDFSSYQKIRDDGAIPNEKNFVPKNKSHYVMDENGKETNDAVIVDGEIYINPKDYTIHKITYKGVLESTNKKIYELNIEYSYTDVTKSTMRLSYISFNNEFFTIDHNDENHFKIIFSKKQENAIILTTNALVDPNFSSTKDLYRLSSGNVTYKIHRIEIKGRQIWIYPKYTKVLDLPLEVNVVNIRDVNGRILNQKKVIQFYQYRELFVQDFNKELTFESKCFISALPLRKNCISTTKNTTRYLMNSPIPLKLKDSIKQ